MAVFYKRVSIQVPSMVQTENKSINKSAAV